MIKWRRWVVTNSNNYSYKKSNCVSDNREIIRDDKLINEYNNKWLLNDETIRIYRDNNNLS